MPRRLALDVGSPLVALGDTSHSLGSWVEPDSGIRGTAAPRHRTVAARRRSGQDADRQGINRAGRAVRPGPQRACRALRLPACRRHGKAPRPREGENTREDCPRVTRSRDAGRSMQEAGPAREGNRALARPYVGGASLRPAHHSAARPSELHRERVTRRVVASILRAPDR